VTYAVINGPDLYIKGYRAHDTTARFDIYDSNDTDLGTNLDWPSAWKVLMPVVRLVPDVEALLHRAIRIPSHDQSPDA
jgi:hypothetical protein